jgi:hypothetical protein
MDALQDLLTAIAIFLEYFIAGYTAIAFVIYSFERRAAEKTRREPLCLPGREDAAVSLAKKVEEERILIPAG